MCSSDLKGTEIVKFDNLLELIANKSVAKKAYDQTIVVDADSIQKKVFA